MSDQPGCPCSICEEDCMMDNLRDRIAAVLTSVEVVLDGDHLNDTSTWLLADAVIRELEIRQQNRYGMRRVVGEWQTFN